MNVISKTLILLALLFSTTMAYSQGCETYLSKADALLSQQKYEDAKKQYENYLDCFPNAPNVSAIKGKIAECEKRRKPVIGIGNFSGYKSDQYESTITNAFNDGRFIVKKAQNARGSNQITDNDIDYVVSGTSTLKQSERIEYIRIGNQSYPKTIPEIVEIILTLKNEKTGQILVNQTWNVNAIYGFANAVFPVECQIKKVSKKEVEIVTVNGGRLFINDVYNVYETKNEGGSTRKTKIGELKVTGSQGSFFKCKIKKGEKEIAYRFKAKANLVVEK